MYNLDEHSEWEVDTSYTPEELTRIRNACTAITTVAAERGISIKFASHFFDQLVKRRGFGKTTAEMLIRTWGRILNRGLHLFKGKEDGTTLVFYDKENGLNMPMLMVRPNVYSVNTMIRDTKWMGREQKVEL